MYIFSAMNYTPIIGCESFKDIRSGDVIRTYDGSSFEYDFLMISEINAEYGYERLFLALSLSSKGFFKMYYYINIKDQIIFDVYSL